jgi:hypothetical protein
MAGIALHELTAAALQIQALADSETEGWEQALSEINTNIQDKVIGCGMIHRNMLAEAQVYVTEANRLVEMARILERRAERLREYTETNMRELGLEEVKADTFKAVWRKLPDVVEITNANDIPAKYSRIVQRIEPNKEDIKEALKNDIPVPGAQLVTGRKKVVFK